MLVLCTKFALQCFDGTISSSWDKCYDREIENFDDHGDEGEVWFGEDAMYRVMRWLERNQVRLTYTFCTHG